MSENLRSKTTSGIGWSFLDNISNSGITFLVGLILARILSPEEYGIMGIITIFVAISNSIVDSGFSNALIRKKDIEDVDYNTAFIFNLLISVFIYIILVLSSNYISIFFHEPILVNVMPIMALIIIINALAIIPRTKFVKAVNFKVQTKISLFSSITSGLIGIIFALKGFGVWSLVSQLLSRQFFYTILLWINNKWLPNIQFSKNSFRELFGFGSKLMLSGIIDTIYKNIYYLIIGKFYTSNQLGQYTRAEQFNIIFSSNLTSVIQRVSYPVLSSINSDSQRLYNAYRKIIKSTMLISFACLLGLSAISKPLVLVLIGDKWVEASEYLQIICFTGMLYPLHAINLNILQVKGRSDIFLKLEIIKKMISVIPIAFGIFYGIKIMLIFSVVNSFLSLWINGYYSSKLINYSITDQIKDILPSFLVSISVAAVMYLISLLPLSVYIVLTLQVTTGFILAILLYEKIKLNEYLEIKQICLNILNKKSI